MLKKLLMLSLALVLSFSLVAFVGCEEKLTQEEIDQIIANVASAEYDTISFDIDVPMSIKVVGGSDPGTMTVAVVGSGFMDMVNEAMQMTMEMEMDIPGEGYEDIDAEIYVVEGWMYTGANILGDEYWMKMALTEPMWQQQDQVKPYVELLATAIDIKDKGTEIVNGVECYVFEVEPDMDALTELLGEETSGLLPADLSDLDMGEIYQELTVKEWLAKDSYLLRKVEIKLVMEMSPSDVGVTSDEFDKMTMEIEMTMRFYDYNQPVSIELPPEALDAEEMPLSY